MEPEIKRIYGDAWGAIKTDFPDVAKMMDEKKVGVDELCEYLDWAYYNSIDLKGDQKNLETIRSGICWEKLANQITKANLKFDAQENHLISETFIGQLSTLLDMSTIADRDPHHPHELPLALSNY